MTSFFQQRAVGSTIIEGHIHLSRTLHHSLDPSVCLDVSRRVRVRVVRVIEQAKMVNVVRENIYNGNISMNPKLHMRLCAFVPFENSEAFLLTVDKGL